ncbi:hypothetical protein [Endozoicomonas arenosclerae]|uniref:hypothetical protein n=1 Tax=Endozoicomonas arenosclerae TaxID=1633495 RepID=UPI0007860284|nr:hypothetical protein [Endozoicomonas arenosclerae]
MGNVLSHNKTKLRVITAALMASAAIFVSGCATHSAQNKDEVITDKRVIDQNKVCQDLGQIFTKSHNGFTDIRKQPAFYNKITIWQTDFQPLDGGCEIWQWSNRYSYVCSRVLPDEQTATRVFDEASRIIGQCLPEKWSQQQVALPDQKGQKVQYSINNQVRGSLEKVSTGGLFSKDWTVYLLISSPENTQ